MKQSFEVFEQSDGIALHLTVTVDGDAFSRAQCGTEITLLRFSKSAARIAVEQAITPTLTKLPDAIRAAIQQTTTKRDDTAFDSIVECGKRERQGEIADLNAKIAELNKTIEAERAAKKAAKKPRTPRKTASPAISARSLPGVDRKAARK